MAKAIYHTEEAKRRGEEDRDLHDSLMLTPLSGEDLITFAVSQLQRYKYIDGGHEVCVYINAYELRYRKQAALDLLIRERAKEDRMSHKKPLVGYSLQQYALSRLEQFHLPSFPGYVANYCDAYRRP